MSEKGRMEEELEGEDRTTSQSRRDMLKSAAALAAAALGGAALLKGSEAAAQVERPPRQIDPDRLQRIQAPRISPVAQDLRIQDLPLQNLGRAMPDLDQEGLDAHRQDIAQYVQPLLDRHRGDLMNTTVTAVSDNINISS